MITAKFEKENGLFISYEITGHANYAEYGKDIVCSAVSALFVTITNQLLCKPYVKKRGDRIEIFNTSEIDHALVEALHNGLFDISTNYPDLIELSTTEFGSD